MVKARNRIGPHDKEVISVIVGSLLGDAYCNKRYIEGTRICYRQSIKNKEYLFWLFEFFNIRGYSSNLLPRQYTRKLHIKGETNLYKEYFGYEFNTYTFRSLDWIHKLFYKKGKKIIKKELLNYINPQVLAIWIMDDGGWTNYGTRISVNCFNLEEVNLLKNYLQTNFGLSATIQKLTNYNNSLPDKYSLYIKSQSINKLIDLILPYMHPSMYYKLGLDNTSL